MDSESNETTDEERRPRTVLPPKRKTAAAREPMLREAREIVPIAKSETDEEVPATDERALTRAEFHPNKFDPTGESTPSDEERSPRGMIPPMPPDIRSAGPKKFNVIFFTAVLPILVFLGIIFIVFQLDKPKAGIELVDGGRLHWFSDGLIGVQIDPDSDKKVYYLIEAPRDAEPRIKFEDRVMTLVIRTEAGTKDIGRSVDWDEAPYAMLISYLDLYAETPKVPCSPEMIDAYLESVGEGAVMAPLANQLRLPVQPAP